MNNRLYSENEVEVLISLILDNITFRSSALGLESAIVNDIKENYMDISDDLSNKLVELINGRNLFLYRTVCSMLNEFRNKI